MQKSKRDKHADFVRIPRWWFQGKGPVGEKWKKLSGAAKLSYMYIKSGFIGKNNGNISLPYSRLKGHRGISSPATYAKALKELEKAGFVERTKHGGLYERCNEYRLNKELDPYL